MRIGRLLGCAALMVGLGGFAAAPAQSQTSIDTIVKRGKVLIAIDMGSSPYAMTNDKMQPEGSDVEAAQLLAKDLGVELEIVPTTGQGRIPVLLSGKADFTMATFSITPERAKSIAFSNPYGIIRSVVFGLKSANIKSPQDLVGKKIGVTRGTTQEPQLVASAPAGTEIVRFDDDATSIAALDRARSMLSAPRTTARWFSTSAIRTNSRSSTTSACSITRSACAGMSKISCSGSTPGSSSTCTTASSDRFSRKPSGKNFRSCRPSECRHDNRD